MDRPLQAGDVCKVVSGLTERKSPNLGLTVTIVRRNLGIYGGDHSKFGPMYRCTGKGIKQMDDAGNFFEVGEADFAGIWLERLPEDPAPVAVKTKEETV